MRMDGVVDPTGFRRNSAPALGSPMRVQWSETRNDMVMPYGEKIVEMLGVMIPEKIGEAPQAEWWRGEVGALNDVPVAQLS